VAVLYPDGGPDPDADTPPTTGPDGTDERFARAVERICAAALDGQPVAVDRPATGNTKRTALVTLADGREVVVQYMTDEGGGRSGTHLLAAEAAVARTVAERTPVPVARVLADGRLADPPVAYLVTERVTGADLHERFAGLPGRARSALARTLGRYLAAIHDAVGFDATGRVGTRDGDLVVTAPLPAGAFYREYLASGLADWPDALAPLEPVVREALDGYLDTLPTDPRLFPWDYRPGNVVVREPTDDPTPVVSAVLDWGEPLAAHPGLSAAKAEYTLADWYVPEADVAALREAFREGYRTVRPFPTEGYDAFRLLGIVASAADAAGRVTRPRYPVLDPDEAVAFHRERIEATVARL
jgi:Ser/Thr protein kinase RdoA (MazF antagonist)